MKNEVKAKLAAVACIPFPVRDELDLHNRKPSSLLPPESFLSDPSDSLIADDF